MIFNLHLSNFKLYRKFKGGTWYKIWWTKTDTIEWTQDERVLNTPYYNRVIKTEKH